jgi:arylsulfatase A-like enzyme
MSFKSFKKHFEGNCIPEKKLLVSFFLFFLFFSHCTKSPLSEFEVFRFIDQLKKENIINSPLIRYPEETESSRKFFPLKSYPLSDLGAGDNPYGIKRKVRFEGTELNAIFAPPRSEYSFILNLSEDSVLEFGIGIVRDKNSEELHKGERGKERGVNFLVTLEIKGRKKSIFQKYIRLQSNKKTHVFSRYSIDLPYKIENARLSLVTKGGEQNFSFWYNPVLYNRGKNSRNVILISIDTLRADHLGCYGYERDTSPNIDSLATESALFFNAYATSPWTLPSHVSILTSLFGVHHQVNNEHEKMDLSLITLADVFRKNSFFCSAFTGGAYVSSAYGFSKGFDIYEESLRPFSMQDSVERIYRDVSKWLDRNKDKNFFLFIHTYQPHNPYASPHPYNTMFLDNNAKWERINLMGYLGRKRGIFKSLPEEERQNIISLYDAEIRYTDEELIRPLLEDLREMGLYEQTMIVFTSDHGEEFYEHKGWEHGHSLYDELLKVPLIIKFPESKFAGKKVENIVPLVDIMPTVLDELYLDVPGLILDGQSLIPVLKGKETKDRIFLADKGNNVLNSHIPQKTSMNMGKNKIILSERFRKQDLKFFLFPPPKIEPVELYDLAEDSIETKNIADEKIKFVDQIIRQVNEIYSQAKQRKTAKPEIDEELKKRLEALGYIQ